MQLRNVYDRFKWYYFDVMFLRIFVFVIAHNFLYGFTVINIKNTVIITEDNYECKDDLLNQSASDL